MAIVADYIAIRDTSFTLEVGQDIDWQTDFNLPNSTQLNQRMILQFFYVSHKDASGPLKFRFKINGTTIRTISVNGNHFATIHEILGGSALNHGSNTIEAKIVGGTGGVNLSDVVLWFQRTA